MAKQGLLIFNGCSFSVFKYILVSVEHAWQCLITVCFGLKLLIVNHLKGPALGIAVKTEAPLLRQCCFCPGELHLHPKKVFPHSFVWSLLESSGRRCAVALWLRLQPMVGEWVATSRAGPKAQRGVGGFSLSQISVSEGSWWPGSSYFSPQKAACSEVKGFCASTILSLMVGLD